MLNKDELHNLHPVIIKCHLRVVCEFKTKMR
jgi:hypothetical protein